MIAISRPETVERCMAALCGAHGAPPVAEIAALPFPAAYRLLARRVAPRPRGVRRAIAALVHCVHGELDAAVRCLEASLAIDFGQYDLQMLLAEILIVGGRWEAYGKKGEYGLDIAAALKGLADPPGRYHPALVGKLFDRFSGEYDERVLREGYAEHAAVARRIATLPLPAGRLRFLDLGCGTGMLGEAVRAAGVDAALVGVDISAAMLERARARGIYEELHCDDIERFLRAGGGDADIVGLASVFPFLGDMRPVLRALGERLRPGSWLVFSHDVAGDGADVQFSRQARFRQSPAYVEACLAEAGFRKVSAEAIVARIDRGEEVAAEVMAARKA